MKIFPLNTEFDFEIIYPNTFKWPALKISTKNGDAISTTSLHNATIRDCIESLGRKYPNSEFIKECLFQKTI